MATIAEQLTSLANTKTAIKDAIVAKGVPVDSGVPFSGYAAKIGEIQGGGGAPATKFGVSIDNILPNNENGVCVPSATMFSIDLSWLTDLGSASVTMPDGTRIYPNHAWDYMFYGNGFLTGTIDLSNLCGADIAVYEIFTEAFRRTSITKVIIPQKERKRGSLSFKFSYTFADCDYLKEIVLPPRIGPDSTLTLGGAFQRLKLSDGIVNFDAVEVLQKSALQNAFGYSELPEEIRFTSLREISNNTSGYAFGATFGNCTGCKRFYFPALTIAEAKSFGNSSTTRTWYNNKDVEEIHFRADMQTTIEALYGYESKFGATKASIIFDL